MTLDSIDPELGPIRHCNRCNEDWPRDGEFWYFDKRGGVMGHCKACWSERARIAPTPKGADFIFRAWQAARS